MIKGFFTSFIALLLLTQAAFGAVTANKGYSNQTTGTNAGTWGIVLNGNFTAIDANLGGRLDINVAGASNITVTTTQAQNVFHLLTGVLTGNIEYILPSQGGFYFINNSTTGAFTVEAIASGGTVGFNIPQGQTALVFTNPDNNVVTGLMSNVFIGQATTGGSANAQTLSAVTPGPWTLTAGNIIYATSGESNSSAATFAGPDGSAVAIKKNGASGLAALAGGEIVSGNQILLEYDGTEYILLNPYISFAPLNNPTFTGTVTTPSVTFNSTSGIIGTITNDSAAAGSVGEYVSSTIAQASATSALNNTVTNITSISLTAGDWDVCGQTSWTATSSPVVNVLQGGINTSNSSMPTIGQYTSISPLTTAVQTADQTITVPCTRASLASTTSYYLNADQSVGSGSMKTYGTIWARRRR
jgi:hypothetical protein